jgi:hypothetical protein
MGQAWQSLVREVVVRALRSQGKDGVEEAEPAAPWNLPAQSLVRPGASLTERLVKADRLVRG